MRYTIYIYVDGSDLHQIADDFRSRISHFIRGEDIQLVDDLYPSDDTMREGDQPDWNLGVNFNPQKMEDEKIEKILAFFHELACENNREFAVGYFDHEKQMNQDLGSIEKEAIYEAELKIIKDIREANKSAHTTPVSAPR